MVARPPLLTIKASSPPPPTRVSFPPAPSRRLSPIFPTRVLLRTLPVASISSVPVKVIFSIFSGVEKLIEDSTVSVPALIF
jgi:hypothetical protein